MLLTYAERRPAQAYDRPATSTFTSSPGEIDLLTADLWEQDLLAHVSRSTGDLVIDLGGVRFFGAAGVHVLERVSAVLVCRGDRLSVVRPSRMASKVLDLCGLLYLIGF